MENLENEVWKDIEGYEYYQISNMGRVKSLKRNRETLLKIRIGKRGYYIVGLNKNNHVDNKIVHRLVAQAFCENDDPVNKTIVHHINEIKTDNKAENLMWVTPLENSLHSSYKISNKNKGHDRSKKIRVRCVETNIIYNSIKEAAVLNNCAPSNIHSAMNRNGTCNGLHWERIDDEELEPLQLDGEIWKVIEDYPNYEVSNLGRIKSLSYNHTKNPRILKQKLSSSGYLCVSLSRGHDENKTHKVHRLVAYYFCEGYKEDLVVNHIDKNKTNNRYDNLEWITQQENSVHGAFNKNPVICIETKRIYKSIRDAENYVKIYGIGSAIKRNGTSAGCHWKYLNYKHNIILRGKDISKLHKNDKRLE